MDTEDESLGSPFVGGGRGDNASDMTTPAGRPISQQHPLWLDRDRLEAISQQMWIHIQKVLFPGERRVRKRSGESTLTLVGGTSAEDVLSEAVLSLLRYEPDGPVNWEAFASSIAHRRAVDALRKATKGRELPDGGEIPIASLDLESPEGQRVADEVADARGEPLDEEVVDRILEDQRLLAVRQVADKVLTQRDRDIFFRITRGETREAIAGDVNLTPQRVGQIYAEAIRKTNDGLKHDPHFRRLYDHEGGNPND